MHIGRHCPDLILRQLPRPSRHHAIAGFRHGIGQGRRIAAIEPDRIRQVRRAEVVHPLTVRGVARHAILGKHRGPCCRQRGIMVLTRDLQHILHHLPDLILVENPIHPKRWHPAVALALAIAVTAQAGIIANLNGENADGTSKIAALEKRLDEVEFQLASGPSEGDVRKTSIMVQLKANASWAELETLLADEGLTIIGGPSDGTLLLSGDAKGAVLTAQITRLRESELIEAADPAV